MSHSPHFCTRIFVQSSLLIFDFKSISIASIAPTITGKNENLFVYRICYLQHTYEGSMIVFFFFVFLITFTFAGKLNSTILQVFVSWYHIRKSSLFCLTLVCVVIERLHQNFVWPFFFFFFFFSINWFLL